MDEEVRCCLCPFTPSPCHPLTLSPPHLVILSSCHTTPPDASDCYEKTTQLGTLFVNSAIGHLPGDLLCLAHGSCDDACGVGCRRRAATQGRGKRRECRRRIAATRHAGGNP